MSLKKNIVNVIEGRRRAPFLQAFLFLMSQLFRLGVAVRHSVYAFGLMKQNKVPVLVISVGNIVAGGSGKTPFVRLLAEACRPFAKPAILSRGYHSRTEQSGANVRVGPAHDAREVGDEPLWLSQALPDLDIWVGKNRSKSAKLAVQEGANLLIMDDGMQHKRLHRDVEIILIDGDNPWGNRHFLPRGKLRDFPSRLKKADLIVLHPYIEATAQEISHLTQAPIIGVAWELLQNPPVKVGLFCGIGNPQRFISSISAKAEVVAILRLPDHEAPSEEELKLFASEAKQRGALALVCTEKDAVKLHINVDLPIIPMPARLKITLTIFFFKDI